MVGPPGSRIAPGRSPIRRRRIGTAAAVPMYVVRRAMIESIASCTNEPVTARMREIADSVTIAAAGVR